MPKLSEEASWIDFILGINRTREVLNQVTEHWVYILEVIRMGRLTEIMQASKKFKVVVAVSWSVFGLKPEVYQGLWKEFPDTTFVCIRYPSGRIPPSLSMNLLARC